ncbi:thiol:disulfide interchange protein DsbA/DsbL [Planctobacterium marinum]|uniref:Thiol:disulfide interchange protein n=1 Tax=Planctobacterium marinum TaxID=1631968 RepID=A0AA48HW39_9ALTE|nr:thiol:disulfide interchange protein DsbA [Planctobacterium marinum]
MKSKLLVIFFALFSFSVFAAEFEEDTHYTVLENPLSNKKGVTEFFSFYCPHCFTQEPFMAEVAAALPDGMKFAKNHVDGMPGRDMAIEQALTKALIVAEMLKVKGEVVASVFRKIHVEESDFTSIADIKAIFVQHGADAAKFDKAMKSFSVAPKAKQMRSKTAELRKQGIGTVPTLVIHGKYVPEIRSIKSFEEYKSLVMFLVNKPL